jgi:hypothetical protein
MPKSIWFPDDEFEQLVTLAKQAGFRVSRGRGSQLRLFVMAAANTACTGRGLQPPAKQVDSTARAISPAKVTGKHQPRQ